MDHRAFDEPVALPLRQNLAELVRDAVRQQRRAVLLWLWDPEWQVYVLNRHAPREEADLFPRVLRRRIARAKANDADPLDPRGWALALEDQPELRGWADAHGFAREEFFPVWRSEGQERVPLAFVHVLTGEELDAESRRGIEEQLVGVGATIVRSRGERQLEAVTSLLKLKGDEQQEAGETAQEHWLFAAARTLTAVTRARACVVFRPDAGGRWESVVAANVEGRSAARFTAAADGVVAAAAKTRTPIRAYGIAADPRMAPDLPMLERVGQELAHDDPFALLVVPVLFGDEALVVFTLYNKRPEFHLAEAFTTTDQETTKLVTQLLAGVMPRFQLYEAVERAALIGAPGALDDPRQRADLFATMQRMLPPVAGAAVVSRRRVQDPPMVRMLGGEPWFDSAEDLAPHVQGIERNGWISRAFPIANVQSGDAFLMLHLRSPLTTVDGQVLTAFLNELSHVLHAETSIQAALDVAHQTQHALRAPLMLITGELHTAHRRLELCRQEKRDALADAQLRSSLEKSHAEAQRLQETLSGPRFLLHDVRPDALRPKRGSLLSVLEDASVALHSAAALRRMRIEIDRAGPAEAVFDRELLYHALFNILDNAVKYGAEGTVVRLGAMRDDESWFLFIENEGPYIPPEDRERIFEPFVRRGGRSQTRVAGTGLGLAVAQAVVAAHGGSVRVESEPGKGDTARTRFIVSLPADAVADGPQLPLAGEGTIRTIHHLDDEPGTVQWIAPALRDDLALKHPDWTLTEVDAAESPRRFRVRNDRGEILVVHRIYATAAEFRRHFPEHAAPGDVVLLDVMHEDDNGSLSPHGSEPRELAESLLDARSVYFLTGFPRALLAAGTAPVPLERVLSKPVDIDGLLATITRHLEIES